MGCDLHSHVELWSGDGWREITALVEWGEYDTGPFQDRHYGAFAWLAGVRNYSAVEPIMEPRGFPSDASEPVREHYEEWGVDAHTPSWLLTSELLAQDYDAEVNDRRVTRQVGPNAWDGGCTGEPEEGELKTLREFLGKSFCADVDKLALLESEGTTRVVFWFDN